MKRLLRALARAMLRVITVSRRTVCGEYDAAALAGEERDELRRILANRERYRRALRGES